MHANTPLTANPDPQDLRNNHPMQITIMSQNVQYRAHAEGRWSGLVETINKVNPDLLMLQECDWLTNAYHRRAAEADFGKRLVVAPSNHLRTAVAWNPGRFTLAGCDTHYTARLHHGYCAPRFTIPDLDPPLEAPLVAISTHLALYSAQTAAQEAQIVGARAYRHGGLAIIAGDLNHLRCATSPCLACSDEEVDGNNEP